MSAIKLPVEAYEGIDGSWFVNDRKSRLCQSLTKPQAHQIVTALNMHDELIAALRPFAECAAESMGKIPDCEAYLWKPSQTSRDLPGINVAHVKAARSILARAEALTETNKPKT